MSTASSASPNYGAITCIIGPMFSGKTTELLRLHDRQMIAKRKCVLVKYAGDTRYDNDLVATHSKVTGRGLTVKADRLAEVRSQIFAKEVQVVSIDEGQFFDDLTETCEELAKAGKLVFVAALNGTFERKPFPQISTLLPLCDTIQQVVAVCMACGADACFTFRCTNERKVEVIGGEGTYQALCRVCHWEKSLEKDQDWSADAQENLCETKETVEEIPRKVLVLNRN